MSSRSAKPQTQTRPRRAAANPKKNAAADSCDSDNDDDVVDDDDDDNDDVDGDDDDDDDDSCPSFSVGNCFSTRLYCYRCKQPGGIGTFIMGKPGPRTSRYASYSSTTRWFHPRCFAYPVKNGVRRVLKARRDFAGLERLSEQQRNELEFELWTNTQAYVLEQLLMNGEGGGQCGAGGGGFSPSSSSSSSSTATGSGTGLPRFPRDTAHLIMDYVTANMYASTDRNPFAIIPERVQQALANARMMSSSLSSSPSSSSSSAAPPKRERDDENAAADGSKRARIDNSSSSSGSSSNSSSSNSSSSSSRRSTVFTCEPPAAWRTAAARHTLSSLKNAQLVAFIQTYTYITASCLKAKAAMVRAIENAFEEDEQEKSGNGNGTNHHEN